LDWIHQSLQNNYVTNDIQYLIAYDCVNNIVPFSVFFHESGNGVVHGQYFGDVGSECMENPYFRMVGSRDNHVGHFLECDDPGDDTFVRDWANIEYECGTTALALDDTRVFRRLSSCEGSWWRFTETNEIRMKRSRFKEFHPASGWRRRKGYYPDLSVLYAQSPLLDWKRIRQIHAHWQIRI
jgi:hypothetical protein